MSPQRKLREYVPTLFPARPGLREHFAADDDARAAHARFNATLQIGYFVLAVRAAGLAAGPMGGFDAAGVDAELFPDGRWRALLVVNIGTPGEHPWFDRLPRLDFEQAVRFM